MDGFWGKEHWDGRSRCCRRSRGAERDVVFVHCARGIERLGVRIPPIVIAQIGAS
jgi:hypothetical protein